MFRQEKNISVQSLALLGTYVPRQCGIATFTKDLHDSLTMHIGDGKAMVLAMDDVADAYPYPEEVRFQIRQSRETDHRTAAELLNIDQVDATLIQHEYGIYGGKDGSYVLEFARHLRTPIITTLHTVLESPTSGQRLVLRELARHSDRLVVMSQLGRELLERVYDVPAEKIAIIPHGIPKLSFVDPHYFKDQFGVEGRTVLLTFGLLSPGKGIEVAIRALPKVVKRHPQVIYLIVGATHPHVLRREGEAYRQSLVRLAEELGVAEHVLFHNQFISLEELCGYIGAADLYISPYPNKAQIVSGTLAYALGAGKPVVSTPYWYAQEMLAEGRGRLFPFGNSEALAAEIVDLLDNEVERHAMRKRAYLHTRAMVWPEIGRAYLELAEEAIAQRRQNPRPVLALPREQRKMAALPEVNLAHLRRMTDGTGMLQHAIYSVPNRDHGYCTDDNARALLTTLLYYDQTRDDEILPLMHTYLSFVHHAFNHQTRRFRNFMSYDRRWLEESGSEDVHGRSIWALGLATALAPTEAAAPLSVRLFDLALGEAENLTAPRAWAFSLVGIHAYLQKYSGDTRARRVLSVLAGRLHDLFVANAGHDWPWCEDVLTYANAKLPHALLAAGQSLGDQRLLDQGLASLDWLIRSQVLGTKRVSLIGNDGWMTRGGMRSRFDQQPIEAMALIDACAEAHRCTGKSIWLNHARTIFGWFMGNNDTQSILYDPQTGGCRDGLHASGPNLNQGAESTLAWLISLLLLTDAERGQEMRRAAQATMATPEIGLADELAAELAGSGSTDSTKGVSGDPDGACLPH
jgi:glycosyltransferase involved in cell wall biosynthesis